MSQRYEEVDHWLDALLRNHTLPRWLSDGAPDSDVVVSSRVRAARNLAGLPFPGACTRKQLLLVAHHVKDAMEKGFEERSLVGDAERSLLIGSRLLSPSHVLDSSIRSVYVSQDRSASVMVNEEDHLRIQSVCGGLSVALARTRTEGLAAWLSGKLPMAMTADRGYLTAWPGNVGSAERVGVMLHLGAMALKKKRPVVPKGFAIRGLLGEGSRGLGGFVQVSVTRRPEADLLDYVRVLIDSEREARANIDVKEADIFEELRGEDDLPTDKAVELVSKLRLRSALDGGFNRSPRDYDALLAVLDLRASSGESASLKRRSLILRFLQQALPWQRP
jgi:protein arginine kinase